MNFNNSNLTFSFISNIKIRLDYNNKLKDVVLTNKLFLIYSTFQLFLIPSTCF